MNSSKVSFRGKVWFATAASLAVFWSAVGFSIASAIG